MSVANMISWVQSQIREYGLCYDDSQIEIIIGIEIKNLKNDMKDG